MKRALAFGDLDVGSALVLTHRRKVPFIHKDADHSRLHQLLQENDYVLLVDKIDGRPSIDAPVASVDRGGERSHLLFVPTHMKADDLLLRMRRERTELAVVVDEFGGTVGVVTMDDLLAALVAVVN